MKRIVAVASLAMMALLAAWLVPGRPCQANANPGIIRIGLIDTLGQGIPRVLVHNVLTPFKELMEEQTSLSSEIVSGGDAHGLAQKLQDDKVQLGVFHGHEYAWAQMKYPKLQTIALCVNKEQLLKAVLVVRKSAGYDSPQSLRGKVISVAKLNRAHCRLYLERRCVRPGSTPEKTFSRVLAPLEVFESLDSVMNGRAAAAVVDAVSLDEYREAFPGRARYLRVLSESEPFPCGVLACYEGKISEGQLKKIRDGLLSARETPRGREVLKSLRITGFELPPEDHADTLSAIVQAYPPLSR